MKKGKGGKDKGGLFGAKEKPDVPTIDFGKDLLKEQKKDRGRKHSVPERKVK